MTNATETQTQTSTQLPAVATGVAQPLTDSSPSTSLNNDRSSREMSKAEQKADPSSSSPTAPKPQREMTKAERRELQEKQRAEKAALKGQPVTISIPSNQQPSATASAAGPSTENNASGSAAKTKQQKEMTKAERRELQERQRAAKAAAKTQPGPSGAAQSQTAAPRNVPPSPSPAVQQHPRSGAGGTHRKLEAARPDGLGGADARGLRIFSHFGTPKPPPTTKGDIHPAIVRLGLQFAEFKITGANARCIATLMAFKTVIQDYVTPPNNTLSRHLMTHLSPQISHLVAARPMSVTMGNAIRQLKLEISGSDIDLPEQDAKNALCQKIDNYVRERIIFADQVIQETAGSKIKDGDVILTYARSSVVEKVLLRAWEDGKQFSVIVADSRPMLEGKKLLRVLSKVGIPCTYLLLPAIGSVITEASMVIVGAHAIHANGAVFSRAGTALVAMMAKQHSVPVMVCCETYKFAESVQLDSFIKNELAPAGDIFDAFPRSRGQEKLQTTGGPNLALLNPLYDLTPASRITAVVTEVGVIPPSSISSIPLALGRTTI
ncbi:IF-2B-domain-containing protein [Coniophora puteana RWD-64-598 SS2]|uniref:Translation initiation factor eIF2B subunit delta n=1 Tax=Coniophora puteana (strain RWD-64-598) TaxID=741705 RepID=A0A5M3MTV4_CONPW|nr:IF-2B-domain-containing protein [Coniophora puteana RWD-64-598 SS2]EIW82526.1 IF-2B-domain-containing protein [Coniophora puteana RWD-64-598 SS2]